jgi:hypothetical protein
MSTSFEGLGAVLPPPITHILLLTLSARVSPVARGMLAMVPILSPTGLYTKESVASIRRPPETDVPPPVKMRVPMVVVGI